MHRSCTKNVVNKKRLLMTVEALKPVLLDLVLDFRTTERPGFFKYVMLCAIWYHVHNGGVLPLVKFLHYISRIHAEISKIYSLSDKCQNIFVRYQNTTGQRSSPPTSKNMFAVHKQIAKMLEMIFCILVYFELFFWTS